MTNRHIKLLALLCAIVWIPVIGFGPIFICALLLGGAWAIAHGVIMIRHFGLEGEETLEPDQFERSARWVGRGQITLDDHEALVGYALDGKGKIPSALVDARLLAKDIREPGWRDPVILTKEPEDQMTLADEVQVKEAGDYPPLPRLPRGYFDGYLSADEPEDTTDWVEVRRGDGSTYWLKGRP